MRRISKSALSLAVGSEAGSDDLLPFEAAPVGRGGASRAAPTGLAADAVVYCALRATNGAGLSATAVSAGAPRAHACGVPTESCAA